MRLSHFPVDAIVAVYNRAITSSDREAAIIIFCLVEDFTTEFFREKLTGKVKEGVDATFLKGNGILATAHNKISLLAGLNWIGNKVYTQLRFLRKIRNEFAHHVEYHDFNDQPISNFIRSMSPREESFLNLFKPPIPSEIPSLRTKYLLRSLLCIHQMVMELAVIQAALRYQIDPRSILDDLDWQPANLKRLGYAVSEIATNILKAQLGSEIEDSTPT